MIDLSENSKNILSFVINYQERNGYSPSLPEIMHAVKLKSFRGVSIHLDKLQKLGYIQRDKNTRRAIKVLLKPQEAQISKKIKIPLVGEIKAGIPSLAQENIEEYKEVPIKLLHGRTDAFLLRVRGDSMVKAGFKPGDIVIVIPQYAAMNGDIVVAFNPEEETATLKRFKKMEDYIVLLPESDNPIYKPIIGRQFAIQGKVIDKLPTNLS